jgi:hypothetical protein
MELLWFPIGDQSVPTSIEQFHEAVQHIGATLLEGKTVRLSIAWVVWDGQD